jgi:hypothetical protein
MLEIPDAAIGPIIAASIAGFVSLLGLTISKEQKVSEFRQAWIDSLRSELVGYMTKVNSIRDAGRVDHVDHAAAVTALLPYYEAINSANFSITLRLNQKEKRSRRVISAMVSLGNLAKDEENFTPSNLRPLETEFLQASQDLLKQEWKRVKSGELVYQLLRYTALIVLVASIAALCWNVVVETQADSIPTTSSATKKPR